MNPVFNRLAKYPVLLAVFCAQLTIVHASYFVPDPDITSPDGHIGVNFWVNQNGSPFYFATYNDDRYLRESRLGLVREDADFSKGLQLISASKTEKVRDKYEILTAKRRLNDYQANRKVYHLQTTDGKKMDVIFQVSNDGIAFRYFFPETNAAIHKITSEATSFHFQPDTRAWLQPMQVSKTGWMQSNPAYEEYYQKDIPVGTPSTLHVGWIYPALFRSQDIWLLVSEGTLGRNYCGTHLADKSPDAEYSIALADPRETIANGPALPESSLPWLTPWRIITVGSLKTITESTLGIDLADKAAYRMSASVKPGKASWSWPLMGDSNTKYDVQKQFIDYAADMGWGCCLIDGLWDTQIGYEKTKELIDYARTKNVKILLWYNSAGDWNTTPQTPRNRMLTHESRIAEFERLKAMGVAGLKVDFFAGDGQSVINYYIDILTDAAPYGFAMNFHGATLPRGWQRTYPNLMTMEAIKGEEFCTFEQKNADEEPTHAAMLPFTRNVFDPMDFTPMVLDRINNRIQRRTTSAFELALPVIFTSGITHYAEIPPGMAKVPDYVKSFIKSIPNVWDDTKFLAGEPGKYVVLARKGDKRWYVAGINAETTARAFTLDISELRPGKSGMLITDGEGGNLSFKRETLKSNKVKQLQITIQPHGGFVAVFE